MLRCSRVQGETFDFGLAERIGGAVPGSTARSAERAIQATNASAWTGGIRRASLGYARARASSASSAGDTTSSKAPACQARSSRAGLPHGDRIAEIRTLASRTASRTACQPDLYGCRLHEYRRGRSRRPTGPHPKEPPTSTATGEPLAIPPIPNLRDVGGCPTRSGCRVRTGLLYRSSGLHGLAPVEGDAIARLAIRTVYDLRLAREQAEAPDRLPAGTRHLPLDVLAAWAKGGPSQLFAWASDPTAARDALADGRAEALWVEQYRALVRLPSARAGYGTLFRDLTIASHRPALVHCTTGKDRTGWVVAALQLLLGVPEDAVMDHFLESRRHLGPLVEPMLAAIAARGGDPELFRPLLDVRPNYLEAALDEVRGTYGPIERYFSDGLGVDKATQMALRTAFTG